MRARGDCHYYYCRYRRRWDRQPVDYCRRPCALLLQGCPGYLAGFREYCPVAGREERHAGRPTRDPSESLSPVRHWVRLGVGRLRLLRPIPGGS